MFVKVDRPEFKTEQYTYVIDDCSKVLELEPKNIKAYMRCSTMAYRALKLYKETKNDLQNLLTLEPNNRRAKQLLTEVEEIEKKTVEVEELTKCETFDNLSKEDGNKLSHKKDQPKIIELDSTETSSDKQPKGKGTGEEISEDIKSKNKGQRLKIVEVKSTEDPDVKVSPPANDETGSKTLRNTKSKKNGQRLKIKEIETVASGSDVMKPTPEGIGKESKVNAGSYNKKEAAEASVKPGASGVPNEDPAKDAGISVKDSASVSGETEAGLSADVVKEGDSAAIATTTHDMFAKPDLVPAKQEAKVVLEIPDKVKSLTEEGNELYKIGHYADALKKFSKCVDHLWNDHVAYSSAVSSLLNNKAACYIKMGDCKQCVNECNKSLALIGDNLIVLIQRGIAYETMEKYAEAFRDFNRVRLLDGSNQVARQHCSRVIKFLEMLHGKSWRKEIFEMNNSSTPQPFLDTDKNKKTTADTILPGSKETEKTSSTAQVDPQKEANPKAVPTKRAPDCEMKVNHKEEFERKKQEQYLRLKESGKTLVKQGKHREAINPYTDCIKLCPEEVIGYTNRALCYLQLKNHELAEADCNAALNIRADNIKALFRRAKARKQMKRYRESSMDLITILKLDVKNAHAQTELNEVLEFLKQEKRETEKYTASKRKRIVVKDVEGDENKKTAFQFLQTWKDVKKKDKAEYLSINLADLLKVIGNKLDADMITMMLQALQLELKSKVLLSGDAAAALHQAIKMNEDGESSKALKLFQQALKLSPKNPNILNGYGEFLEKEELIEAKNLYTRALINDPLHSRAMANWQRTLTFDQEMLERIDKKCLQLNEVPDENAALQRVMKEEYYRQIHHTTAMAGNTMTLSMTRAVVETKMAIRGIEEHNVILGLDEALKYINATLIRETGSVTIESVIEIHKRVLRHANPLEAGKFRNTQVYVKNHKPPHPTDVERFMEEFNNWLSSPGELHPVEFAALAHYGLVHIHPFSDGNGRTARLLMNLILVKANFPPVTIKENERHKYYACLQDANDGYMRPFIRFIARCAERAIDDWRVFVSNNNIIEIT